MADLTEDDIAKVLSGMLPEDGDGKEEHWAAANKHAAAELIKALPKLREVAATSKLAHLRELPYLMAKEGRRFRNDYLTKAG